MNSWTGPPPGKRDARSAAGVQAAGRRMDDPQDRDDPHGSGQHDGHHVPAGAHVADRRGLTATGAVTVAVALGMLGAVIDVSTGRGLRTVFAVCFVLGSALAALLVHREDLKAAVIMPPLTYCAVAFVGGVVGNSSAGGSFVKTQGMELISSLVLGAPVLFIATGAALVIAVFRAMTSRRA